MCERAVGKYSIVGDTICEPFPTAPYQQLPHIVSVHEDTPDVACTIGHEVVDLWMTTILPVSVRVWFISAWSHGILYRRER